jgi:hypothetical protein
MIGLLLLHALVVGAAGASFDVYNPTAWEGAGVVEVAAGRVGAPGTIDWSKVKLLRDGVEVPFAVREGRAHWKAGLRAPVDAPGAEDLVVFDCAVAPGAWAHIDVLPGEPARDSALVRKDGRIEVGYADCGMSIDEATGLIQSYRALGVERLAGPMKVSVSRLRDAGYELQGAMGVGYQQASIGVLRDAEAPVAARLVSSSSTPAMTEVNFELAAGEGGPALGLTYRLHRSGLLEVVADERPWQGESPWLHYAVAYSLDAAGKGTAVPLIEDRWAFYGFREYTASVKTTAKALDSGLVVLGDETVNGRRFVRRFYPVAPGADLKAATELADEGFVVDVTPVRVKPDGAVRVAFPASEEAIAQELKKALGEAGIALSEEEGKGFLVRAELSGAEAAGVSGDGFVVQREDRGVCLRARTRLGLYSAVRAVSEHLVRCGDGTLPLIARNPVVDFRAGGFGGGDFEVDFPYGADEEWTAVFDRLLGSGMNTFACLGMWSNWKMPVSYRYMPELRSDAPDAYDESSGAKFSELEAQREHGQKLLRYLQDRGGKVWLWLPIGCVPTTFAKRFPEAMAPGTDKFPCFTHPEYRKYVDAFLRELVETYPIDGLVLIRDDNGGICTCDRCKEYVAKSRTKSAVWEQYLLIYDGLRALGFKGDVGVYPYFDFYEPKIDPLLPKDLYVIGHGSGTAVLSRAYEYVGPMGDTWLDNVYANFKVSPSPRMRRLLADRGGFWIGGAYWGCELPWHAVGEFGWEPTLTANSLRYDWGRSVLGADAAVPFVRTSDAYERLWDINARYMLPAEWIKLSPERHAEVVAEGEATAQKYRDCLAELEKAIGAGKQEAWLGHMRLFAPFFEYHLHRLDRFADLREKVLANRAAVEGPEGLPKDVREAVLADYREMYEWAAKYDAAMQAAPHDGMMDKTRWMTKPYKEWMAGYDQWLDGQLEVKQFAGAMKLNVGELHAGQPFTLRVEMKNLGLCPWVPEAGQSLELSGDAEKLGLPKVWAFEGEPVAPGDVRVVELKGTAPEGTGEAKVSVAFTSPYRVPDKFLQAEVKLPW